MLVSILKTLQERTEERETWPSEEQYKEKIAWDEFWRRQGPSLLIHACTYGSVKLVKYLMEMNCCSDGR